MSQNHRFGTSLSTRSQGRLQGKLQRTKPQRRPRSQASQSSRDAAQMWLDESTPSVDLPLRAIWPLVIDKASSLVGLTFQAFTEQRPCTTPLLPCNLIRRVVISALLSHVLNAHGPTLMHSSCLLLFKNCSKMLLRSSGQDDLQICLPDQACTVFLTIFQTVRKLPMAERPRGWMSFCRVPLARSFLRSF